MAGRDPFVQDQQQGCAVLLRGQIGATQRLVQFLGPVPRHRIAVIEIGQCQAHTRRHVDHIEDLRHGEGAEQRIEGARLGIAVVIPGYIVDGGLQAPVGFGHMADGVFVFVGGQIKGSSAAHQIPSVDDEIRIQRVHGGYTGFKRLTRLGQHLGSTPVPNRCRVVVGVRHHDESNGH